MVLPIIDSHKTRLVAGLLREQSYHGNYRKLRIQFTTIEPSKQPTLERVHMSYGQSDYKASLKPCWMNSPIDGLRAIVHNLTSSAHIETTVNQLN